MYAAHFVNFWMAASRASKDGSWVSHMFSSSFTASMAEMRLALEIGERVWKIHLDYEGVKNVKKREISFIGREKKWNKKEAKKENKEKGDKRKVFMSEKTIQIARK